MGRRIVTIQQGLRELGRLKMGAQVTTSSGKRRPAALETWRMTSYGPIGRELLEAAAAIVGGEVKPWADAPRPGGVELTTRASSLEIVVPPVPDPCSTSLELWSRAGCLRRCDGERAEKYQGRGRGWRVGPCECDDPTDPNRRECSIIMRFQVMLPWLPGLGVWRVDTHSFFAATELETALAVLASRHADGVVIPAQLRIEQRESRRAYVGDDGETKTEVSKFSMPVIDMRMTVNQLVAGEGMRIALPSGDRRTPEGRPALPAGDVDPPDLPMSVPMPAPSSAPPRMVVDDETGEVLEGVIADPEPVKVPPADAGQDAATRKAAIERWRSIGLDDETIQAVMTEVTGKTSTADMTDSEIWNVEGALRQRAAEGS